MQINQPGNKYIISRARTMRAEGASAFQLGLPEWWSFKTILHSLSGFRTGRGDLEVGLGIRGNLGYC